MGRIIAEIYAALYPSGYLKAERSYEDDVLAVPPALLCPTCQGSGLNPEVLACKINGLNIAEYYQLELADLVDELKQINDPLGKSIAQQTIPL